VTTPPTTIALRTSIAVCLFSVLYLTACSARPSNAEEPADVVVSMVGLLTNPEKAEGQVVQVAGYLQHDAGLQLYLTRDHAEIADAMSSIRVQMPDASIVHCAGAYAIVVGRFGRSEFGGFEILETWRVSRFEPELKRCWTRSDPRNDDDG
jgi:hypothetical protein